MILSSSLVGSPLSSYMPKLPAALPNRDYAVNAHSMAVGDIDGNGIDDILVGDWSWPRQHGTYALLQQANGQFTISFQDVYKAISTNWPMVNASAGEKSNLLIDLHLVDVNGDGYDDLIAGWGNGSTSSYVFINNRGTFSVANKIALPDSIYGRDNQIHLRTFNFDFNNDGKPDLAILWSRYEPYYGGNYIQLLQNDGAGNFTDVTTSRIDKPIQDAMGERQQWTDSWQLLDLNGDGSIDIVGQRTVASSAPIVYLNDGTGHFTVTEIPTNGIDVGQVIHWADFDQDGVVEFVDFRLTGNAAQTTDSFQFNIFKLAGDALLPSRINQIKTGTELDDVLVGTNLNDMFVGKGGNDTLNGGGGIDTAVFSGARAAYTVTRASSAATVQAKTGNDGTDTLTNVERLKFSDFSVALDVSGYAGTTAKILGAVFGKAAVANKEYAGIGLQLLDGGMSYLNLMQAALNAKLGAGASNATVVNLLYTNVVGSAPGAADLAFYVGLLNNGTYTAASLGVLAADTALNTVNINLVGLATSGLEYLPQG